MRVKEETDPKRYYRDYLAKKNEIISFETGEEFEKEWKRLTEKG